MVCLGDELWKPIPRSSPGTVHSASLRSNGRRVRRWVCRTGSPPQLSDPLWRARLPTWNLMHKKVVAGRTRSSWCTPATCSIPFPIQSLRPTTATNIFFFIASSLSSLLLHYSHLLVNQRLDPVCSHFPFIDPESMPTTLLVPHGQAKQRERTRQS